MLTLKYCNFHCILRLQFWHLENLPHFNFVDFHSPTTTLQQWCATWVFTNSQYLPVLNFVNLTSSYNTVGPLFVFLFIMLCDWCVFCVCFVLLLTVESFAFMFWCWCNRLKWASFEFFSLPGCIHLWNGLYLYCVGWGVKLWLLTHSPRNKMHSKILCFMSY